VLKGIESLNRVMIIGSRGQDGTLLRELLISQGVEVLGFTRPDLTQLIEKATHLGKSNYQEFRVDLSNFDYCLEAVGSLRPDTIFHLAAEHAPSHIMTGSDWDSRKSLMRKTHATITENFAKSILKVDTECQLIVAGSSRMYQAREALLRVNERTSVSPIDYYGATKVAAWEILRKYRNQYGLRMKMAILFNHESTLRRAGFLFNDIATQINAYLTGKQKCLFLRNPEFNGDWHSAQDTVRGLQLMAENPEIEDLVLASGKISSVRQLIEEYFSEFQTKPCPSIVTTGDNRESGKRYDVVGDITLAERYGWHRSFTLSQVLHEIVTKV